MCDPKNNENVTVKEKIQDKFGWWILSIFLASGFGGALGTWGVDYLKDKAKVDASIKMIDYADTTLGGDKYLSIVVKNNGDNEGIVTSIILNGKTHSEFLSSHTIGPQKLRKKQIEFVTSGYCPGKTYCEFFVKTSDKVIKKIEFKNK